MNAKKILALLLGAMMLLSLAACGAKDNDKQADMSGDGSAMTGEPKTDEEALALHKELLERENALLSENAELWEKVFMAADKGMTMQEDGKNYGDFLLDTVEAAKEQFTDKEYEWLKESATEISNIENKLTELEEKYPEIMQKSMDGDMSMPAGSDTSLFTLLPSRSFPSKAGNFCILPSSGGVVISLPAGTLMLPSSAGVPDKLGNFSSNAASRSSIFLISVAFSFSSSYSSSVNCSLAASMVLSRNSP